MKYYPPELVVLGSATDAIQQSLLKSGDDFDSHDPNGMTAAAYRADE
jgi:hypothetical protein